MRQKEIRREAIHSPRIVAERTLTLPDLEITCGCVSQALQGSSSDRMRPCSQLGLLGGLTHAITETENCHNRLCTSWRARKPSGVIQVKSKGVRTRAANGSNWLLEAKGLRTMAGWRERGKRPGVQWPGESRASLCKGSEGRQSGPRRENIHLFPCLVSS